MVLGGPYLKSLLVVVYNEEMQSSCIFSYLKKIVHPTLYSFSFSLIYVLIKTKGLSLLSSISFL